MSLLETPPVGDHADERVLEPAPGEPPTASGAAKAAAWLAVLALIVAAVTIPRAGQDGFGSDTFGRVLAGVVEQFDGDRWERIAVGDEVPSVARLRTRTEAGELEVRGGSVSFARGTEVEVRGDRVTLDTGSVLFEADRPYSVTRGVVDGRGRGTWRVDAAGASRFGVYQGGIAVSEDGGRELSVASLRQVTLQDGKLGDAVVPLRYLAADPWDRRLLADALAVDDLLDDVSANLRDTYGTALQDPAFYGDFAVVDGALAGSLDTLAPAVEDGRFGPPAPTLIATVITDLLVRDARLGLDTALSDLTSLRRDGATWGLVVRDNDLGPADVRSALDRALRRRAVSVQEGTATPPRATASGPSTVAPPPATDDPAEDDPDEGGGDPDPGPTSGPSEEPSEEPSEPADDPGALNPVEETIEDLGSLLDPVPGGQEVAEDVADAVDTIDDLLPPPPSRSGQEPQTQPSDRPTSVADVVEGLLGGS